MMRQCLLMRKKPLQIVPTVHKDVTERLINTQPTLAREARKVLDKNKSERHIRGGMATKDKYERNKKMHLTS